jgi:hypothetical protein
MTLGLAMTCLTPAMTTSNIAEDRPLDGATSES